MRKTPRRLDGYPASDGVFFPTGKRLGNELYELVERASVGVLLADRVRHGTVGMNFIQSPRFIERKILGFLGITLEGVNLSDGDFLCRRTPNHIKVSGLLNSFLKNACLEGEFLSDPVRDH